MAAWRRIGAQSTVLRACSTWSPNWHHSPAFVAAQYLLLDGAFYMPRHQRFSCARGLRGHFGADEDLRVHGNVYAQNLPARRSAGCHRTCGLLRLDWTFIVQPVRVLAVRLHDRAERRSAEDLHSASQPRLETTSFGFRIPTLHSLEFVCSVFFTLH